MSFKESVLVVAIIVVFALMILIATVLNKKQHTIRADSCPDFWSTSRESVGACLKSEFGCCPDKRKSKIDAKGSNCTDSCSTTEFGCCSDYATPKTDADGTNCPVKCFNVHQLGTVSSTCTSIPAEMDFTSEQYTGSASVCNKQTWAKQCGLTWDGITNVGSAC
jgi:hypothetical protein